MQKRIVPKKGSLSTNAKKVMSEKTYRFCCKLIWGHVPLDKEWAMGTDIYKEESRKILSKYPFLEKSIGYTEKEVKHVYNRDPFFD